MLYLVLLSILAVGFYSATNTASQVSNNERKVVAASLAAESGMEFMRYQLAQLNIPHNATQDQLATLVYNQLSANIVGTPNLAGNTMSTNGTLISLPQSGYITLNSSGAQFRATVGVSGLNLVVTVTGVDSDQSLSRSIRLNYQMVQHASAIFNYGVASKGKIYTQGNSQILGATDPTKGSVLSTCMSDPTPINIQGKVVSGDISVTNPSANVTVKAGTSVGGTTNPTDIAKDHVHKGVEAPEFPTIDTSVFSAYATNTYVSGRSSYVNTVVPPNTNPKFNANVTIQGVLYIQAPNSVTFNGNATIQGTIVSQNNVVPDLAKNLIYFKGNVNASGVETLPASFGDLRNLTGSFLLAPGFYVTFTGDFHTVDGSIVTSKMAMTGNAGGTINGTVINMDDYEMDISGSSEIVINSTGTSNHPSGVFFNSQFVPLPGTYQELTQ
jgi:hypothetical protein